MMQCSKYSIWGKGLSPLSCAGPIFKGSTCLLGHITTEKTDLCQYAVCITRNTMLKK